MTSKKTALLPYANETCFSSILCVVRNFRWFCSPKNSTAEKKAEHRNETIVYNFELSMRICEMNLRQKKQKLRNTYCLMRTSEYSEQVKQLNPTQANQILFAIDFSYFFLAII